MKKWNNYLKKVSIYLALLLNASILTQCQFIVDIFSGEDTTIEPEIIPFFEKGDTLIYSNSFQTDSFIVTKAKSYDAGEVDETNWAEDYEHFESIMKQINCNDSCYEFRSTIRPWEYYVGVISSSASSFALRKYYSGHSLTIGQFKIDNLYGSYNLKPDSVTGKEINYVLYSKKYGVVEYKLNNGEAFLITEDCITMLKARE